MGNTTDKIEAYRHTLRKLDSWQPFLMAESRLPGPRGNLELAQAVFLEGNASLFNDLIKYTSNVAPANSPEEFLAFCGVYGQGRFLSRDNLPAWEDLKVFASDPRWRTREAVAMALQAFGDRDMAGLLVRMKEWSTGNRYLQRAAVAALCEPRLLKTEYEVVELLEILGDITKSIIASKDRREDSFKTLRQALGYCWSVAVAALPQQGKIAMEHWFASKDNDVMWVMRENLKKNRLIKMDADWVERWCLESG